MWMVNLGGLLLIGLIVWWFWLYSAKESAADEGEILIVVENGVYQPARLRVKAGEQLVLQFVRKDASPCAEMVLFPDLEISETLPLNKPKTIRLPALEPGEYKFHCQMQMYRGELVAT